MIRVLRGVRVLRGNRVLRGDRMLRWQSYALANALRSCPGAASGGAWPYGLACGWQ